jgi:hypothetical protein
MSNKCILDALTTYKLINKSIPFHFRSQEKSKISLLGPNPPSPSCPKTVSGGCLQYSRYPGQPFFMSSTSHQRSRLPLPPLPPSPPPTHLLLGLASLFLHSVALRGFLYEMLGFPPPLKGHFYNI